MGTWAGLCSITKGDDHIPRLILNGFKALAVEVSMGDPVVLEGFHRKGMRLPSGMAAGGTRSQVLGKEMRREGLGQQAPGTVSRTHKKQTQRGHVCHCA